ncbi:MAG TPA: hypothetical protein VFI94_02690 [Pseudolabrys sp.]|nr:hypothetical protein [Pseudolabrys sp.]
MAIHFARRSQPLLSVRFIRFAKLTALLADVSTIFSAVLIVGWQIVILLKDGSWPALPLTLVFSTSKGEIYSTASIEKNGESHQATNFIDVLLQVPIIMLLLLAVVFLTAFYVWLSSVERELTKTQI